MLLGGHRIRTVSVVSVVVYRLPVFFLLCHVVKIVFADD
jgi:hypothetical protein